MSQFDETKEIEEEIAEDDGTASLDTRLTIFKREFKSHVLNTKILFGILITIGIAIFIFVILIWLKL